MKNLSTSVQLSEGCTLHIKTFDRLTTTELYDLLHIRVAVFVVEQSCPYQDIDYCDQNALHLWLTDTDGKIVPLSRVCPDGTRQDDIHIGRVISTERGKGYGALILQKTLDAVQQYFPKTGLASSL